MLKEAPHGPPVTMEIAADLNAMAAVLPGECIAEFQHGVPGMHGGGGKSVADTGVALNCKPGSAPGTRTAKADALNAELRDVVIHIVVLRGVVHGEARHSDGKGIDLAGGEGMVPGNDSLLSEIVEVGAEARQVFGRGGGTVTGRKAAFRSKGITAEEDIAVDENVIDAEGALIVEVSFVADVEVVVGIRTARHGHHVGLRKDLLQEGLELLVDAVRGNLIAGELSARIGEVGGTGR